MENIIKVGIGVMVLKDNRILLGHRVKNGRDTGGIYEPDSWCLPGGKQEYGETIFEGAVREVKEETNLDIAKLELFGAVDDIQPGKHFVTLWVLAREADGELKVTEPQKQDAWEWFALNALPQNLYSPSRKFLNAYLERNKI
ncbi:MAG: nucleotide triphosphate diphosphatase NUDT15 [Marvinbryantia sp.]|jgi:8-oxo-dGTP diphosphatase